MQLAPLGWFVKKPSLKALWSFDAKSAVLSSPAIIELDKKQVVILGTKDGKIISMSEGKLLWEYQLKTKLGQVEKYFYEEETISSITRTPLVADINADGKQEIVFGSENGTVTALSNRGKKLWQFKCPAPVRTSISVCKSKLIVFGDMNGNVYFLKGDGTLVRKYAAAVAIKSDLLIIDGGKQIIFGTSAGRVYSINNDAKLTWQFDARSAILNKPALVKNEDSQIIIGTRKGDVYGLDMQGMQKWHHQIEGSIAADFTIADIDGDKKQEILVVADNVLNVLSSNGTLLWIYTASMWIRTQPVVTDINSDNAQEVIIASLDGNIYILESQRKYSLNYMPGLAGVGMQPGHYSNLLTEAPGVAEGKELMRISTGDMITGMAYSRKQSLLIACLHTGKILGYKCQTE